MTFLGCSARKLKTIYSLKRSFNQLWDFRSLCSSRSHKLMWTYIFPALCLKATWTMIRGYSDISNVVTSYINNVELFDDE